MDDGEVWRGGGEVGVWGGGGGGGRTQGGGGGGTGSLKVGTHCQTTAPAFLGCPPLSFH